jgi:hypothetical protein
MFLLRVRESTFTLIHNTQTCIYVKVKFTLEQATKAMTGSRGIAILFFNLGHAPAQIRSRGVRKISSPPVFDPGPSSP